MISMVTLSAVHLYIVGSIHIWVKPMTIKALIFKLVCGPILPRQGFGVRSRPETTDILSTETFFIVSKRADMDYMNVFVSYYNINLILPLPLTMPEYLF